MTLRPYKTEDSKIICSWVKDEKQLFQWSADRIGKWQKDAGTRNSVCKIAVPRQPHNFGRILQQPKSPRLLRICRIQRIQHKNYEHSRQRLGMRGYGIIYLENYSPSSAIS